MAAKNINMSLLERYSRSDIAHFKKDIAQVIRVAKEIDRFYGKWEKDMDKYMPKYKKFIGLFNEKYKGVEIKVKIGVEGVKTRFLLKEGSIRDVFDNAASKIIGLKAVGASKFNVVGVTDSDAFLKEVEKGKNKLHLTYYDRELGTRTLFLSYDKKEKKVELHYDPKQIVLDNSPEFEIACFYALKHGINRKIEIYEEGATFGFDDLLSEREKAEWLDKMNPRFLE
jgi:hypothetical protein